VSLALPFLEELICDEEQFSAFDYSTDTLAFRKGRKSSRPALLGGNSEEEMRIMIAWKEFFY